MSNLVTTSYCDLVAGSQTRAGEFVSSVLSAIPTAIAKPILDYQRVNVQRDIIMSAIEANQRTREDIMETIRTLGKEGKLTPELMTMLFASYNQALIQLPF